MELNVTFRVIFLTRIGVVDSGIVDSTASTSFSALIEVDYHAFRSTYIRYISSEAYGSVRFRAALALLCRRGVWRVSSTCFRLCSLIIANLRRRLRRLQVYQ